MPRNVRNFWVDVDVDGKDTRISGGPSAKDGGFSEKIKIRCRGEVVEALSIYGINRRDGSNLLVVEDGDGKEVYRLEVER